MSLKQRLEEKVQKVLNLRAFVTSCLALVAAGSMTSCGTLGNSLDAELENLWRDPSGPQRINDWGASRARPVYNWGNGPQKIYDGGASRARPAYDGGASRARPINNRSSRARLLNDGGASRARVAPNNSKGPQKCTVSPNFISSNDTSNTGQTDVMNIIKNKKNQGMG